MVGDLIDRRAMGSPEVTLPSEAAFKRAVLGAFDYLVEEHGYSARVSESLAIVEYIGDRLRFCVSREHGSYVMEITVERLDTGWKYGLYVILRALAPNEKRRAEASGANTSKMNSGLAKMSDMCKCHLGPVLAMNEEAWGKIDSLSKEMNRLYAMKVKREENKYRGDVAWERENWKEALYLYRDAEAALAPYQKRRLRFLIKKFED